MAGKNPASETLQTPFGVLSFPHLFEARAPAPNAEPRFSVTLIFDKQAQATPEFKAMKQAAAKVAKEKWGDKMPAGLRSPFRDASEKEYDGYEDGSVFISAWTKNKPGVIDGSLQTCMPADVWAGQLARASIRFFAYDTSGNKGIGVGLNNVQVDTATDMPRLDGRKSAASEFGSLGSADATDASDNADDVDDLPF